MRTDTDVFWCRGRACGKHGRHAAGAEERRPFCALGGVDRQERCLRVFVTPSISFWPFPALAGHSRFTVEFCCEAFSIFLVVQELVWGNGQPCPVLLLPHTLADPGAELSAKLHTGQCCGKAGVGCWVAAKVGGSWGNCFLKAIIGLTMGGSFPPLTLPSPALHLHIVAVGPCTGSGAEPAQGHAADRGHEAAARRCQQGQVETRNFYCLCCGGMCVGKEKLTWRCWLQGKSKANRRPLVTSERPRLNKGNAGLLLKGKVI